MAQLEDLKESISDLDDDALLARLSELRSNRRSGGATAKPTPAKQAMSMEAMKALIAGMSAEERAAFMETLS